MRRDTRPLPIDQLRPVYASHLYTGATIANNTINIQDPAPVPSLKTVSKTVPRAINDEFDKAAETGQRTIRGISHEK